MDSNTQQNETTPLPGSYPEGECRAPGNLFMLAAAPAGKRSLTFWKVTAIGLGAGLTVGGGLALSGMELLLTLLNISHTPLAEAGIYAAAMLSLGLLGAGLGAAWASFQPPEKTPLPAALLEAALEKATPAEEAQKHPEKPVVFSIRTIVYTDENDEPTANSQNRNQLLPAAREALLSMDHTKVTPN